MLSQLAFFVLRGEYMKELNQNRAPIYEALEQFREMRVVPFDVPGHKRGRGNPELTAFLGEACVSIPSPSSVRLRNWQQTLSAQPMRF